MEVLQPNVKRPYGVTSINTSVFDNTSNLIKARNIRESQVAGEYFVDVTKNEIKRNAW